MNASSKSVEVPITEDQIQNMLNLSEYCFILWDQQGKIIDCSLATLKFFGISTKEKFNKNFEKLSPVYQPNGELSKNTLAKKIGHAFLFGSTSFDWLHKKSNGCHIDCCVHLAPMEYLDQKVVCLYIKENFCNLIDIKNPENTTQNQPNVNIINDYIHVLLDYAPIACFLFNSNFDVIDCNHHAIKLFEMDSKGEMNRSFIANNAPKNQPNGQDSTEYAASYLMQAFQHGMVETKWTVKTKSGKEFVNDVTAVRVPYQDDFAVMVYLRENNKHFEFAKQMHERRLTERRLQAMLDSSPLCTFLMDEDFSVVDCNQVAVSLFEFKSKKEFMDSVHQIVAYHQGGISSEAEILGKVKEAFEVGHAKLEWMAGTMSEKEIPLEFTIVRVKLEDKNLVIIYAQDLTEFYKYQEAERRTKQRLQTMLDSSPIACIIADKDYVVLEANQKAVELFELMDKDEFFRRFNELSPEYQPDGRGSKEKFYEKARIAFEAGNVHFEWMHVTAFGELMPCEVSLVKVELQDNNLLLGYIRDLRELKKAISMKEHLEELAYKDHLTGLYNRRYFMEEAKRTFELSSQNNFPFSILMLDVDHFKKINDTYSHMVGDEVLKILTMRVLRVLRDNSIMARYGGEEFIIMLKDTNLENALKAASRIQKTIASSNFSIDSLDIKITASVGVASNTNLNLSLQDIIANADAAMYRAKKAGRNTISD
ncbi:MAG: diguanylate cyclase [Defluviitaleaceae bacterium]|nr:diguanylate cyclase [Defluviitaleaceae bacterium]